MQWPQGVNIPAHSAVPHGHQMHRAHSFADFGQHHIDGFPVQNSYGHRHSLSGGTHNYNPTIPEHNQHQMITRAPSLPAHSSYYVPEQNNPGVATLNTNPAPIQTYHIPRHQSSHEMLQSSPSTYSSASRASPISQDPYYTHQSSQTPTYALQNTSPVEQQPMVQYQQVPHHLAQHTQPMPTPVTHVTHVQEQYQAPPQQDGQWYDNVAYQAPVEVISHIQAYPQAHVFHDPWGVQKLDSYDDPTLQMPSARIENM